jgi:glycine dehydrogenase
MTNPLTFLSYDPHKLKRELSPFYISATENELEEMIKVCGKKSLADFYSHIPTKLHFKNFNLAPELSYTELITHLKEISEKNKSHLSFIGDSLPQYSIPESTDYVCSIRGLTTAYTPYQPERSQGTLSALFIYSSLISKLTGFEAINASLYDRSTAIFEALCSASRIQKDKKLFILTASLFEEDIRVIKTMIEGTGFEILLCPINHQDGLTNLDLLEKMVRDHKEKLAAICFPQINNLGLLEDVHSLTDICKENNLTSICSIDPVLLSKGGLIPPSLFGSREEGVDLIVGEAQHLALSPNFGGPGLGIFGVRFNDKQKNNIRQSAGRFVGKTKDQDGKESLCMILSTREQHIRREKATSNICSNQSFLATLAGAAILWRGEKGMESLITKSRENCQYFLSKALASNSFRLAFPTAFINEVVLECSQPVKNYIEKGIEEGIHIGLEVGSRIHGGKQLLKISFSDKHQKSDIDKLLSLLGAGAQAIKASIPKIEAHFLRSIDPLIPSFDADYLKKYYTDLGEQNLSPDDNIYPLGSCTMKYNPYINDWAASLSGFTQIHPLAPDSAAQGSLHILYDIQESFKKITGLAGVTTQPVAGAQGELVGLKLFQAYHRDHSPNHKRDIIIIPKSAHGTNPATASVAGFETKKVGDELTGIITLEANQDAQIDIAELKAHVEKYGRRIAGIMITNPNTSGIFESEFKEIADLIHSVDGLVYMDGANMNAIAGWLDLNAMGVDAVHNNLHKTWTIPHGGGGPGDAIVAVSEKLLPYLPGKQIEKDAQGTYRSFKASKSIGEFHRHYGNFAHKVRAYTYIKALGTPGVKKMSAVSVLASNYIYENLKGLFPFLPAAADKVPRMHEFIMTLSEEMFTKVMGTGLSRAQVIPQAGKLFLDYGFHAPTVAFPEVYGLMIEPTESFTKSELDRFIEVVKSIHFIIMEHPQVLVTAPHFTPVKKVDEVGANKTIILQDSLETLPAIHQPQISFNALNAMTVKEIEKKIIAAANRH